MQSFRVLFRLFAPGQRQRATRMRRFGLLGSLMLGVLLTKATGQVPFTIQGPGVNPAHYRITRFADGLNFPVGMVQLDDGSILTATSNGSGSFFNTRSGSLIRLVDSNGDGAVDSRSTLINDVPGGLITTVRRTNDLLFVTGQGSAPISVLRLGTNPSDPITLVGQMEVNYPGGGWLHPHSALAVRELEQTVGSRNYELYFQLGSKTNFDETTATANLTSTLGVSGRLAGDAVHRVVLQDNGQTVVASGLQQIATGLRNAAGFAFHPVTGDLYVQDNGIDGVVNANEPTSADEINLIRASDLGGEIDDFGFPNSYVEYRTGNFIGDVGEPLIAFLPIPAPADGDEGEGPNDIAFAPAAFPRPFQNGLFVGMHGRFSQAGLDNEENPLVFADLNTNAYFYFIGNEADVGHLDGLLSTADSLFMADISPAGGFGGGNANSGVIYQVQSLIPSIDDLAAAIRTGDGNSRFDVTGDLQVDEADRRELVLEVQQSSFGDSNWDGRFDSSDLVAVFSAGEYEDEIDQNSGWRQGDWNGDGEFSTADLVFVFSEGGYDAGVVAVPEPSTRVLFLVGTVLCGVVRRSGAKGDRAERKQTVSTCVLTSGDASR